MACWASLRSIRFAASIAGGDTTGLQREARIKDGSYAITLAINAREFISTLRQDIMDTQYAPTHTSNDLLFSLDSARSRQSLNV